MSNALMNFIHIYCIAFALVLRIPENVAVEQFAVDDWQNNIIPEVGSTDDMNWAERTNFNPVKRVPNGFTGVRGKKKSTSQEFDELQYIFDILRTDARLNRTPKSISRKAYNWNNMYEDDMQKRALKNAFMGVRGKKNSEHSFFKRAVYNDQSTERKRFEDFTNKFVAVRGKKSRDDLETDDADNGSLRKFAKIKEKRDLGKEDTLQLQEKLQ